MSVETSFPRVRFFSGARGQRIAYAISGSGPPLILPAWWVSHVERDWAAPRFRAFFEPLTRHHTVIRYDRPGVGLSVRERTEFTLDSEVAQLDALIEHLGFERVSLLGFSCGGPPAIRYIERNPERVERLILVGSYAHGADLTSPKVLKALANLVRAHWGLGAKTITDLFTPDLAKDESRQMIRSQHEWASPEFAARLLELSGRMDCREQAPAVPIPTLVIHRRKDKTVPIEAGRALAALIPDADFLTLDGNAHVPWEGDSARIVEAILAFLGASDDESAASMIAPNPDDCLWRREGDLWLVQFEGQAAHLPQRKGFEDLAILLRHPMREISARELASGPGETAIKGSAPSTGSDAILDDRARAEFVERVREIEAELASARNEGDLARTERLSEEHEALLDMLATTEGFGGRARRFTDDAERARKAVSARVRDAIKRLSEVHPALAEHLGSSITTGLSCAYRPTPARTWHT